MQQLGPSVLRFGAPVAPLSFCDPVMLARQAAPSATLAVVTWSSAWARELNLQPLSEVGLGCSVGGLRHARAHADAG
jgi:hypothetical protein